jgi:hypothetical protein
VIGALLGKYAPSMSVPGSSLKRFVPSVGCWIISGLAKTVPCDWKSYATRTPGNRVTLNVTLLDTAFGGTMALIPFAIGKVPPAGSMTLDTVLWETGLVQTRALTEYVVVEVA